VSRVADAVSGQEGGQRVGKVGNVCQGLGLWGSANDLMQDDNREPDLGAAAGGPWEV